MSYLSPLDMQQSYVLKILSTFTVKDDKCVMIVPSHAQNLPIFSPVVPVRGEVQPHSV